MTSILSAGAPVNAKDLNNRSVFVSSSIPAAQVYQVFNFDIPTTANIGSIEFEHCTNSPFVGSPCTPPAGLSLGTATLALQTHNTGFSIDTVNSTATKMIITRAPSSGIVGSSSYRFNGVINPNTAGQTVFVRISTYASTDATGARNDGGTVAFATQSSFSIGAFVPPYLIFCAGATVALNCSNFTGSLVSFGELSNTQTKTATSQFSGATNDPTGYNVFVYGQPLTAGNLVIPGMNGGASLVGTGQFGLNLKANSNPVVGANSAGVGTATISPGYDTANSFRFVNGEKLVSSTTSTEFNIQTVSYIVNVPTGQGPGYYATTMTYIAVVSF